MSSFQSRASSRMESGISPDAFGAGRTSSKYPQSESSLQFYAPCRFPYSTSRAFVPVKSLVQSALKSLVNRWRHWGLIRQEPTTEYTEWQ
jgi:hypothetical protein